MEHPLQSQVDIVLAAPRVVGGWAKDAFKLLNYLTKLKHPNDPIAREMGERLDALAAAIDSFYIDTIQRVDPTYDPHSASSRVGEVAWQMVPIGRAATAGRVALRSRTATIPRRILSLEETAARRMVAYRGGFVSDKTVAKSLVPSLSRIEREIIKEIGAQKGTKRIDFIVRDVCNKRSLGERQLRTILKHQGFTPPPRPAGIPKDWKVTISEKGGGIKYSLQTYRKTGHITTSVEVRIMPGDPKSLNHAQRKAYVMHQAGGSHYDKFGNLVSRNSFEAHIPYEEYDFSKISKAINYE
ncbi:MAG: hypothetical protein KFB93_01420 [Simkaniaceae bacterium]|nr:MAG: hypothetical protein KFB93_01420 [Simkaniaceae bacterium]